MRPVTNKTPASPDAKDAILFIFTKLWLADLYAGFFFVRSSGYNSLNSQSVYTQGIYVHSATRSEKQY